MPLVSFILPTHNRADVLGFAIESVLAQSVADFELLIVGDGCNDETERVVHDFADSRITWMPFAKGPNLGYAHRNVAFQRATGEFIAFMAHDDLICCDHLEILLPHFTDAAIDIVHSRPVWVDPRGRAVPSTFSLRNPKHLQDFLARKLNSIPASCFIHRRECFAKVGYWDESLPNCGDWDFWARIIEHGRGKNIAVDFRATCLHFRANWRTGPRVAPEEIDAWDRWPISRGEIVTSLEQEPRTDGPEQARFWHAMAAHPERWAARFRNELAAQIDSRVALADSALSDADARIAQLEAQLKEARAQLAQSCSLEYARSLEAECGRKDSWILELEALCLAKERWIEKLQRDIDALNSIARADHRE